ncbi:putative protein YlbL [Paenibacillus sp. CECT 9249]|uniref:YlbL family protein n=1 Tax=Paenibacillus sp. CECT 9249 TaxID=2845385 RepID=UPI001E2DC455|nr:PDZ domain-containing protein [Paenibacillus sp. CECT 9249]CAH0122101.1 putative protein YlbL [Paenibacillus sp. CECT 9249]
MGKQYANRSGMKLLLYIFGIVVAAYILVFMPTPYVIYEPGSAEEIRPMVSIPSADTTENGAFMLTTVLRKNANIVSIVASTFDANAQISKNNLAGRSEKEYATEQLINMSDSQSNAMMAAYTHANVPFQVVTDKLVVIYNIPELETHNDFQSGDEILSVNGVKIEKYEDMAYALQNNRVGDTIRSTVLRKGKETVVSAQLIEIKDPEGKSRAALGLRLGIVQKVKADDPSKQITFSAGDIGGPSAGLMFTLEIYNQLTAGDLSKGYRIAGTGTVTPSGSVGIIGGVQHKIVAADRQRADIFFVPQDNYAEAKRKWEQIKSSMQLVPVKTVDEALDYLTQLPDKD